jgi:hypothetical protein
VADLRQVVENEREQRKARRDWAVPMLAAFLGAIIGGGFSLAAVWWTLNRQDEADGRTARAAAYADYIDGVVQDEITVSGALGAYRIDHDFNALYDATRDVGWSHLGSGQAKLTAVAPRTISEAANYASGSLTSFQLLVTKYRASGKPDESKLLLAWSETTKRVSKLQVLVANDVTP